MKFDTFTSTINEKKGLWDNMHARRKAGKPKRKPGDKNYPKTLNVEQTCGKGEYFCNDDQKCKPIPEGHKVKADGELVSEGEAWTRKEGLQEILTQELISLLEHGTVSMSGN